VHGIDYQEISSPVVRYDFIWVILAIVAAKILKLKQFDFKTAILFGDLKEEIYSQKDTNMKLNLFLNFNIFQLWAEIGTQML
jgi:hypothetical protein